MTFWGALYALAAALLSLQGLHRAWMVWRVLRARAAPPPATAPAGPAGPAPWVTVQLPVYNEREVVAGLLDAVAALRWPLERLEVQLLDDSTDDTPAVAAPAVERARARGVDVQVLRRPTREGFKAGALAHGLSRARGEYVAIFDADFRPEPDFLERMMPSFAAPDVGMVQARWGHTNADANPLTRAQACLLDAHFSVEHRGRQAAGLWLHFNGTAGIWRRAAIEAGGGWQGDTLTEDLDLSYRAQLAGWRLCYRDDVVAPAELPADFRSFTTQQRRWAKGSVQTLRKLGRRVLTARVPWLVRAEALHHLGGNLAWPVAVLLTLLLPVVAVRGGLGAAEMLLGLPMLLVSSGTHALYYALPGRRRGADLALALVLGTGLAWSQTVAVAEVLTGRAGGFARTPKGARGSYLGELGASAPTAEVALGAWQLVGAIGALRGGAWAAAPFLLLFAAGYLWAAVGRRAEAPPAPVGHPAGWPTQG